MRHLNYALGAVLLLSACGDPLRDVARLSDVSVANEAVSVSKGPADFEASQGGLIGRLLNRDADDPTNAVVNAALTDVPEATPDREDRRRGILASMFGGAAGADAPRTGPDAQDVAAGTLMPFGEIARVCDIAANQMGTPIGSEGGFRVFDSQPKSTEPRPYYITGFDDNCARTFAGAVVVTGDVETHEFVRYRPSNQNIPYSGADTAYEALKARECRVGNGEPCGANTQRLNRETQFITAYDFFGGTFSAVPTRWTQILIHDGEVLAISVKGK